MKLTVILPDGKTFEKEYESPVTGEMVLKDLEEKPQYDILGCRLNNKNRRLTFPITEDGTLELTDLRDPYANMSYQASLTLLYLKAIHLVLGSEAKVTIANSLSKGLFTRIHIAVIRNETAEAIENKMRELVEQNIMITEDKFQREDALKLLKRLNMKTEAGLFETAEDLHSAYACSIDGDYNIFYVHTLPSTGYLRLFNIRRYRNGMLLRFPHPSDPSVVPPYEEQRMLYECFAEEAHWKSLMGVKYVADLNQKVLDNDYKDLIMLSEALHEKKIADIAGMIKENKKRIILIAGPSSSGKTTFAKRLCIQLRVIGLRPLYLGTDDYFVNRDEMIPDENGNLDFEGLSAVDTFLFETQMNDLLEGRKVDIPEFNFVTGEKEFGKHITSIDDSQPIVIEGIHGLNPKLTEDISDDQKFKIYISPLTQLHIDHHHRIPTTDARLLRRLVRDHRTRGRSAAVTLHSWPSVRAGEEVNIFPYNSEADVFFNSQCLYELAVLKKYAKPLLKEITQDQPEFAEAQRMLQFLKFFVSIEDDSVIANNSIVREFIGGSVLVG
ncbi:MAG: hypothetical protein K6A40_00910 [Solobacterium sp.]|nr:hypothetical protein [Solobacterium sp.]